MIRYIRNFFSSFKRLCKPDKQLKEDIVDLLQDGQARTVFSIWVDLKQEGLADDDVAYAVWSLVKDGVIRSTRDPVDLGPAVVHYHYYELYY